MKKPVSLILTLILIVCFAGSAFAEETWECPACGRQNSKNFCGNCGLEKGAATAPEPDWECPSCGTANMEMMNFCNSCGQARPAAEADWECPNCGTMNMGIMNFCNSCGNAKGAEAEAMIPEGLNVGDHCTFGNYGGEPIEWRVLGVKESSYVLIGEYGLDAVPFNESYRSDNDWENSYIRRWLNEDFYNMAFSADEKTMILPGVTDDNVWLLSVGEAAQYFANDGDRVCYPTDYAKNNGANINDLGAGWWWLRSPGYDSNYAAGVNYDGLIFSGGSNVSRGNAIVRPVIVVSLGHLKS